MIMLWIAAYVVASCWMEAMLSPLNVPSMGFSSKQTLIGQQSESELTRRAA